MFPPTCRRQSHNQTRTDNSGDRLMNPSGELTLSESRHQLENDLLQGVVQPESRREESVRGEEEKTRVSWWRHMSGWEWRVLKQKVDYIKMNRMWLMIYDRSGRIRSGRAVRKRKTRRSDDGEMSTVTGGWRRWRWMQLNVFSVQLQALKAGSLFYVQRKRWRNDSDESCRWQTTDEKQPSGKREGGERGGVSHLSISSGLVSWTWMPHLGQSLLSSKCCTMQLLQTAGEATGTHFIAVELVSPMATLCDVITSNKHTETENHKLVSPRAILLTHLGN